MDVIFDIEARFDLPVWTERVPSQSNPADVLSERLSLFWEAPRGWKLILGKCGSRWLSSQRPSDTPKALRRAESAAVGEV